MIVLLLVAVGLDSASAHDHEPPNARLELDTGDAQRGNIYSSSWTRDPPALTSQGLVCGRQFNDGVPSFPAPLRASVGSHAGLVVFAKSQPPQEVELAAWREVDRQGQPMGDLEAIPHTLTPDIEDGEVVGWAASFQVALDGDLYVDAFGIWQDEQGCAFQQDASWVFHLSSDPPPTCRGEVATLEGTPYAYPSDTLTGTPERDVIVARRGSDRISGGGGDDLVCAGRGADVISGGSGQDRIWAGRGNDNLDGGSDIDRCHGEEGKDRFTRCDR